MSEDQLALMIPIAALMIPIVAIIAGIRKVMFERWLQHKERMHSGINNQLEAQLAAIRDELNRLRNTSTQYDMSLQQLLDNLSQRLDNMEGRVQHSSAPSQTEPTHLRIGQ